MIAYIFASKYLHIMEIRRDVFQAIADPTRRQIIALLAQKPLNLNEIAGNFEVSRQAVSLHVKILTECGLILVKKQGREKYCEAHLEALDEVAAWIGYCKQFWTKQFKSLDTYLLKVQTRKK